MVMLNLAFIFVIHYLIKHHSLGASWLKQWYVHGWIGYVFLSNLVASFITFLMLLPELLQIQIRFDSAMFKGMLIYSWPILIANLSYIINENLDKLLLGKLLPANISEHDVGV